MILLVLRLRKYGGSSAGWRPSGDSELDIMLKVLRVWQSTNATLGCERREGTLVARDRRMQHAGSSAGVRATMEGGHINWCLMPVVAEAGG